MTEETDRELEGRQPFFGRPVYDHDDATSPWEIGAGSGLSVWYERQHRLTHVDHVDQLSVPSPLAPPHSAILGRCRGLHAGVVQGGVP